MWQVMIKIRVKINEMEAQRVIQKSQGNKELFFEKVSKIDKPLAELAKGNRE
jgi:hypothetical protein